MKSQKATLLDLALIAPFLVGSAAADFAVADVGRPIRCDTEQYESLAANAKAPPSDSLPIQ